MRSTLHIFGVVNFLSIPMVWALYPETANRTLEEIDLLFASKSPFAWDEERHFKELKDKQPKDAIDSETATEEQKN